MIMAKPKRAKTQQPTRLTHDQQWAAWQKDIERIKNETTLVFRNRYLFREVRQMFQDNEHLKSCGGYVYRWLFEMYGRDMVLAVGRELDRTTEVVNLIQFMYQMSQRPRVITKERYLAHFPADTVVPVVMQEDQFRELAGSKGYLDIAVIKKDRNWLEKQCRRVMKYRHKMVAHRTTMELSVSNADIDKALDAIEDILKKYYLILTGRGLVGAEPAIQFDWTEPFNVAWLPRTTETEL